MKEALFYKSEPVMKTRCLLCPHRCNMKAGAAGLCRSRVNHEGILVSLNYEQVAAYSLDPVEKKPLYHFYPGTRFVTYGTNGCTFHCLFCCNEKISQKDAPTVHLTADDLVGMAMKHKAKGVAASFSEPVVFYEFTQDTARAARAQGLKSVVVTNGFILEQPLRQWLPDIDAMKVDLKGSEVFYREVSGGQQEPILRTIRIAFESKVHVEVAIPLIPSLNDYHEDFSALIKSVAAISPLIPFHILSYSPANKMSVEATPLQTLDRAYELASEALRFVYLGNVTGVKEKQTTYCPRCRKALIKRDGLKVLENSLLGGACPGCGEKIPGYFD